MSTNRLMEELRRKRAGLPPRGDPGPLPQPTRPPRRQRPPAARPPAREPAGQGQVEPREELKVADHATLERMKEATPAKVAVGRAGLRYRTETLLQFAADFAVAQAAVESQIPEGWAEQHGWLAVQTACGDAEEFLARPDLGRQLSPQAEAAIRQDAAATGGVDVQVVVGDGLSASAVMQNAPDMVASLLAELKARGVTAGRPIFVRHCRSKIMDLVGPMVGARVGVIMLGERPGLGTGDGMSAYLTWNPDPERNDAERQAISNVHGRGLLPADAGVHAANIIEAIMAQQTSGVNLDLEAVPIPSSERKRENKANPSSLLGCGQSHGQQCQNARNGLPGKECRRSDGRPCEVCRS